MLRRLPGSLRQDCILFTVDEPTSLRIELHHALETLAALPMFSTDVPSIFRTTNAPPRSTSLAQGHLKAAQGVLITARKQCQLRGSGHSNSELPIHLPRTPTSPSTSLSMFDSWRRLSFGVVLVYACLRHIYRCVRDCLFLWVFLYHESISCPCSYTSIVGISQARVCFVIRRGKFYRETHPSASDLLRGIQCIYRTLEQCCSQHGDPIPPNLTALRKSVHSILFARVSDAEHQEVSSFPVSKKDSITLSSSISA